MSMNFPVPTLGRFYIVVAGVTPVAMNQQPRNKSSWKRGSGDELEYPVVLE
jgi:hypothetical protein